MKPRHGPLLCLLLLTGCAGGGEWQKPGIDSAATARARRDCKAAAASAVRSDIQINEDITATRRGDWQRAGHVRLEEEGMRDATLRRADAIIARCMASKGFARGS